MIDRNAIYRLAALITLLIASGCGPKAEEAGSPGATPQGAKGKRAYPMLRSKQSVSHDTVSAPGGPAERDTSVGSTAPGAGQGDGSAASGRTSSIQPRARKRLAAPARFNLTAKALGKTMEIASDTLSSKLGLLCTEIDDAVRPGGDPYVMRVQRFAQFGQTDTLFRFQWSAWIDNDAGTLTGRPATVGGKKGYEITLRGRMHLNILMKTATKCIKLQTRDQVELKGFSPTWPPYGASLSLADNSVGFYHVNVIADSGAKPMVEVLGAEVTIGKGTSPYFDRAPRITRATLLDAAGAPWRKGNVKGVHLEWSGTSDVINSSRFAGYNIYRSIDPDDPASWQRVASVPATQTSYNDSDYDGSETIFYRVTHRATYPAEFEYEGSDLPPTPVRGVLP